MESCIQKITERQGKMKNIEKYTNTKDALDAYNKLNSRELFETWLELELEETREQYLWEAAEAVIDEWYHPQQNATCLNYLCEKIVDLKKAVEREKQKPIRNCDRPECATAKEAQHVWRKEDGGKTAYYEWLLATSTKGETK